MSVEVITEKTKYLQVIRLYVLKTQVSYLTIITIRKFSEVVGILRKNCFPIYNLRQDKEI